MKLFFNFLFFIMLVLPTSGFLFANELKGEYIIEVTKLNIGKLFWDIELTNTYYKISIKLQDKGILSGLYKFEGNYEVEGKIINNVLIPSNYKQFWSTKKKKRDIEISFINGFLTELRMLPKEKEEPRIEYIGIENHLDPISSFLSLAMDKQHSKTIDGRRIYSMFVEKKINVGNMETKNILIKDYVNIWTDHKKNDLEYIKISKKLGSEIISMPLIIEIKFKGILFSLKKI